MSTQVVKEAQKFIEESAVDIERDLTNLCSDIPDMNVTACKLFVQAYGDKIVKEIASLLDPNSTCVAIKLCPASPVAVVERSTADDDCTYSTQAACDANTTCTWCKCAAVPSQCWTKKEAAGLPPGVYVCDKTSETAVSVLERSLAVRGDPNGTMCTVCTDLFTSIQTILSTPSDQQQILQVG
jgi:hypothetical protein